MSKWKNIFEMELMVIKYLLIILIGIFLSCSQKSKSNDKKECEFNPYMFTLPYLYDDTIQGKIELYRKGTDFDNVEYSHEFLLSNGILNHIEGNTGFYLKEVCYCYNFIIYLEVDSCISKHKFSEIQFKKERVGDSWLYIITEYKYNGLIMKKENANFTLMQTKCIP